MADPSHRFALALDGSDLLTWAPTWTSLDNLYPNLVTSYTIDRGRQYEMDRTDVGRAVVQIADPDGVLDPTNTTGPYYGLIEPLLQAIIRRYDPVAATWYTRYRGFIEELDYVYDPALRVNRLVISLIDLFEILSRTDMHPGIFGDSPPSGHNLEASVWFGGSPVVGDRIEQILTNAWGATAVGNFAVIFTGNVTLHDATYSPGESAMTAVQECADAEFPTVSNVFVDRKGRLCFHGRLAKFDPAGTAAGAGSSAWDYHHWVAGDGAAVAAHPTTTAQLREFSYNRGLAKVINQALATPVYMLDADMSGTPTSIGSGLTRRGQLIYDSSSIASRGIRSWSAQNLLTKAGVGPTDDLTECRKFAQYFCMNYAEPNNRITNIAFKSMNPTRIGAAPNWALLSSIDIGDMIDVTVNSPATSPRPGGLFNAVPFFIEGIHEECTPLNSGYDMVTMHLDLSPQAYFTGGNPWA